MREWDKTSNFGLAGYRRHWFKNHSPYSDLIDNLEIELFCSEIERHSERQKTFGIVFLPDEIYLHQSIFHRRGESWRLATHSHTAGQVIHSFPYFPLPGSSESQGAIMHKLRTPQQVDVKKYLDTKYYSWDDTRAAQVVPYRDNQLFSFVNTPEAIHSSTIADGPARRYILSCVVTYANVGEGTVRDGNTVAAPSHSPNS